MTFSLVKKIAAPFFVIPVLMAIMIVSTFIAQGIHIGAIERVDRETKKLHAITHLQYNIAALLMAVNDFIITEKSDYKHSYETLLKEAQGGLKSLSELQLTNQERASLNTIHNSLEHIDEIAQKIFRLEHVKTNG